MPQLARRRPGVSPIVAWTAVVAWMTVIFILSSQPDLGEGLGRWRFGLAKVGHVVVFSILGVLTAHAMDRSRLSRRTWWAVVFVALYAIVDELHQSFVPGRTPMLMDVVIDSVSGLAGAIAWSRLGRSWFARRIRNVRLERMKLAASHTLGDQRPEAGEVILSEGFVPPRRRRAEGTDRRLPDEVRR
ncbi:MAG: VanZ family protein [Chloroflexota bacterium]